MLRVEFTSKEKVKPHEFANISIFTNLREAANRWSNQQAGGLAPFSGNPPMGSGGYTQNQGPGALPMFEATVGRVNCEARGIKNFKALPCKYYAVDGSCPYGAMCTYKHGDENPYPPPPAQQFANEMGNRAFGGDIKESRG